MENVTARTTKEINLTCGMSGNHNIIFTLVPIVYSCNFVIGMVGNCMVVAVIYCYMRLKTVANIFVLNLAVSDLTFLITLPMWATFTATGYHWPFGGFLCKTSAGLAMLNLYTSTFFLTALSIDRYLAIVHPVRSRRFRTVAYARITFVVVWLVALVLSVPTALTRDVLNVANTNNTLCGVLHPTSENRERLKGLLLAISLMKSLMGFLVPFVIIITCYCLIGRALVGARHIQKSSRSRDDEVLRMLAAAVLAFFLCWMPHQVFHLLQVLTQLMKMENCTLVEIIDTAMPFTICLAYLNSCVNPIVYGFVGRNFRKNCKRLLRCSPSRPTGGHPSISSKMSALSFRASEALSLTALKSKASSDGK
ncbi:type-1 angiotensin II receptor [Syngnathus typhle]|uniref:type-1 angiotensin II receptor n=1 Tax=Syngnathus typhle TaxID=161592 RepID=UPI002A6B2564|nr:type-1 angiotensin II receptor [Syngnathus typhle]XP_061122158.1 type-1 angiotensin II receptor [Syngnathus typhle]XP_061122159.1 type-1 angiotensin II receptor [Syngnathus typhle]XP_061122160.1 type-1 angiotensin II receptor [Syngnathus typhle]XP_061122161.1 type-1 angiotensin II receptor [Syngnathus typhle]XP_061122163.1 type-1 angiotensin II receptor [Syngnathus typhle]XP_061122164.1 type-1 angiotensin II receptor [Syngnathus typhle]